MNAVIMAVMTGLWMAGGGASAGAGHAAQGGKVFELKRQVLPAKKGGSRPAGGGRVSLKPIEEMPPGVEAAEARSGSILLDKGNAGRYQLVLAKSTTDRKRYDRVCVDANGDGKFDPTECIDITRSAGPVRVLIRQKDYLAVAVCPIKLVLTGGAAKVDYWISLNITQYGKGEAHIGFGSETCVVGKVTFGKKTDLLAIHDAGCTGRFDRRIELPAAQGGDRRRVSPTRACQILLDVNGNGRFDGLDRYRGMGVENRWLTRYLRRGGRYYELAVAADGRSIRVTPAKPKLGALKVPEGVVSATLIGPAFAMGIRSDDEQLKFPAGRYTVERYRYRKGRATLSANDWYHKGVFELKADQTRSFRAGPPLTLKLQVRPHAFDKRRRRPRQVYLSLEVADCAGRSVDDIRSAALRGRPPAPRFKIVSKAGKTVSTGSFEYG